MKLLRHLSTALATALLFGGAASAAPAPTPSPTPSAHRTMRLSADRIAFYYDRFLVEADGHVRITTGDGLTVTGSTMTMDLKNNRFMVAGGVHLDSPNGTQDGAALADFMDFNRVYFVPITTEPDRWTFENGDYTHPLKGREMPGDTFAFPDLSQNTPYLYARSAVIGERQFARFQNVVLMIGTIKAAPVPTYYINFSADPKLSENSLAGANYDATLQVAGNANSITAVHFRYDQLNHAYVSVEQHLASKNAYAVFSVNPLSEPSKFYSLITDYQPTKTFELHSSTLFHAIQNGFTMPAQAQQVTDITAVQALKDDSSFALNYQTVNYCLLGLSGPGRLCGSSPFVVGQPLSLSHPQSWSLGFSTFEFPKRSRLPIKIRLRASVGFIHDAVPLQTFGGAAYDTIWNHAVGISAFAPSIRIGNREDARKAYYLNGSINAQRQWFSVPHHIDTVDSVASISRVFDAASALSSYASYEVLQTGDYYNEGQQLAYPSYTPTIGGNSFDSYAAFHGVATLRTFSIGVNFNPSPDFGFTLLARKHKDFPIPEPGLFPTPPLNVLGQSVATTYLGQPPYDISGDLRVKVMRHYYLDISRTYYFNFGTLRWSPSFVIQVTQ